MTNSERKSFFTRKNRPKTVRLNLPMTQEQQERKKLEVMHYFFHVVLFYKENYKRIFDSFESICIGQVIPNHSNLGFYYGMEVHLINRYSTPTEVENSCYVTFPTEEGFYRFKFEKNQLHLSTGILNPKTGAYDFEPLNFDQDHIFTELQKLSNEFGIAPTFITKTPNPGTFKNLQRIRFNHIRLIKLRLSSQNQSATQT